MALLFYYKYIPFAVSSLNHLLSISLTVPHITLPIGISFFTFQGMSYVIDVFRGQVPAQKNPLNVALYIALFPQLIAGPIVRYADIYSQITCRTISLELCAQGLERFILGLAKKVMIANIMGGVADAIFAQGASQIDVPSAWIGAFCYTMQIYYDFSGYSDMAIGMGKMLGIHFLENFNYPYIAKYMTDFWRRWHISLSSWFRDYLYIPLGGNRRGNVYVHLIIVFLITGLWHGAAWTFVFWGAWHGFFLVLERPFRRQIDQWNQTAGVFMKIMQHCYCMFVVMLGWVFFRATSLSSGLKYIKVMLGVAHPKGVQFGWGYYVNGQVLVTAIFAVMFSMPLFPWFRRTLAENNNGWVWTAQLLKPVLYLSMAGLSVVYLVNSHYNPFIYFRF